MLHATSCRVLHNVFITRRYNVTHDYGPAGAAAAAAKLANWDGRFAVIALLRRRAKPKSQATTAMATT